VTAIMIYVVNLVIVLTTIIIFKTGNRILLLITTLVFALLFILFGRKLDQVPIVVPSNQQKPHKGEK